MYNFTITELFILSFFYFFAYKRLLTYLHYFQQEEYNNKRFIKWIFAKRVFDKKLSLITLAMLIISLAMPIINIYFNLILFMLLLGPIFLIFALLEDNPRKKGKKKLVLTPRAKRILYLAFVLEIWFAYSIGAGYNYLSLIFIIQTIPLVLALSNLLWSPYEKLVQFRFLDEAKAIMNKHNPFVIGITGSFGKTSVKHILGHILQTHSPTLFTSGSVNTQMGITRIIREKLTPQTKYFIVEMGAYGIGSIDKICQLTPPNMGIITSIGNAHYERFKSLENVAEAKFELANAVIQKSKNGQVIAPENILHLTASKAFTQQHKNNLTTCGNSQNSDVQIKSATQTPKGLQVEIIWKNESHTLFAPLFGEHHANNIVLAFTAACQLGIPPKTVITALKSTPQIAHRLEVKKQQNDNILIDDAYNANPTGFANALNLLEMLAKPNKGRKILITPGMIELGAKHDEEHTKLAKLASQKADIVLAILPNRIPTFVEELSKSSKETSTELILCENFAEAQKWLQNNSQQNDVVLLENDLPDLFENLPKL